MTPRATRNEHFSEIGASAARSTWPDASPAWQLDGTRLAVLSAVSFLGLALGVFAQAFRQAPRTEHWAQPVMSLHGSLMVFMCWAPSIAFLFEPSCVPPSKRSTDLRGRGACLGLYSLGGLVLAVASLLGGGRTGFRFYLNYFAAPTDATLAMAAGFALIAMAIGINGAFCFDHAQRAARRGDTDLLTKSFGIAGAVQAIAAPIAPLLPVLMLLDSRLGAGIFQPQHGGDPTRLGSLFWLCAHPMLTAAVIPFIGLVTASVMGGRPAATLSAAEGIAIGTLCFLTWGMRAEVVLGEVARNFFAVTGLLLFLMLGRPVVALLLLALQRGRARWQKHSVVQFALLVVSLSVAIPSGAALVLPSLGMRLSASSFGLAHLHWLGFSVGAGAIIGCLLTAIPAPKRSISVGIVMLMAGALALFTLEIVAGAKGKAVGRMILHGLSILALSGTGLLLTHLPAALTHLRGARMGDEPKSDSPSDSEQAGDLSELREESVAS